MKILVLGANGRTGRWIVDEALRAGISVNALVRTTGTFQESEGLRIITGSCEHRKTLDKAMTGVDAVVCALNISRTSDFPWAKLKSPPDLISRTIRQTIDLMYAHGISRLITISASGVGDSADEIPSWFRWLINNSNIGKGYADHEAQEKIVRNTDLEWTIVRPVGLTNSKKTSQVRVSIHGEPRRGLMISRRTVARFIVQEIGKREYLQQSLTLSTD